MTFLPRLFARAALMAAACHVPCGFANAGDYSAAMDDPTNAYDAPVPGFLGPDGIGKARLDTFETDDNGDPIFENPDNYTNPLFFGWAADVTDYQRSDSDTPFDDPSLALGPVTGDNFDVVALGELNAAAISAGGNPGSITLELAKPVKDLSGADFVVFENGTIAQFNYGGAGVGGVFAELAYVEVSANGEDFVRFPSTSLTPPNVGGYGSIDPTGVHQLAGKHVNGYGDSWGTPFDLAVVGLSQITHIRLVDIPGNGTYTDHLGNPIHDPWTTFGSGGFDLEAVGAISSTVTYDDWPQLETLDPSVRGKSDDPDGDGLPNLLEYAFASLPWKADAPDVGTSHGFTTDESGTFPEFRFLRDERLTDLTYEVQVSGSLVEGAWTTIASSSGGGPMQAAAGFNPVISETSASAITSIGVIREVRVRDIVPVSGQGQRFFRVKVRCETAPLVSP